MSSAAQKETKLDTKSIAVNQNKPSLVFCHTVGSMLPFLPLGDLDLGIVWCPKPKVWVDDNFVHLQTKRKEGDLSFQIHQKNYVSLHI